MASDLTSWPRLRDAWWVYALACGAVVLFPVGLVVRVCCGLGRCDGSVPQHLFDLDSVGGLPRLFTTGLFAAVCALAWWAARQCAGGARTWWTALGLDALTAAAFPAQPHVGALSAASSTFVEEFGEALTALLLLVTVRWHLPPRPITQQPLQDTRSANNAP